MMTTLAVAALGSLKVLILLVAAAGLSLALRGRPARLRAVVWATALVGSLLIPAVATVVPSFFVELPIAFSPPAVEGASRPAVSFAPVDPMPGLVDGPATVVPSPVVGAQPAWSLPDLDVSVAIVWGVVALILLLAQGTGLLQLSRIVRSSQPIEDPEWLDLARRVGDQIGCRQHVRLVLSPDLDIPSVLGVLRPVIVLPTQSRRWLHDRREAVLQHEMVHIVRFDWPLRVLARIARSIYWFNPLVWWAVRRLEFEQEMACDEEVLSLGSRASSYACHLLGIARTAVQSPAVATAGLAMARRSHLEERIMRILSRSKHRRVGLAVILPAVVLTGALVPAIASVQPADPEPRNASPALKAAVAEMEEAEEKLEPYLDRISDVEVDMEPILKQIEAVELHIDHEELARIESEMAPIIEQIETQMEPILAEIESIQIDMEPVHEQLEAMHEAFETMTFHIDDGTMEEIQRQIHEQMEAHRADLESIHIDMEPYQAKLAELHAQLEPMHERLAEMTREQTAKIQEQLENSEGMMELKQEQMELMHERMEKIHREMEPVREEMERMGARLESAMVSDVADVLRSHLAPVTGPAAPFTEAAARIIDEGNIHIDDDVLELRASRREVLEILEDLFAPERVGTQEAFNAAIESASDEVSDLQIVMK